MYGTAVFDLTSWSPGQPAVINGGVPPPDQLCKTILWPRGDGGSVCHPRCHPDGPILRPRRGPTMNTTSTTTTTTQKQNTAREGAASTATHANNKTRRRRSQKVGSRPPKTKPAPPTKKKQQQRKTIIRTHRRTTQDTSVDPKTFIQQKQQGSLLREFGPESDCVLETKEKKKERETSTVLLLSSRGKGYGTVRTPVVCSSRGVVNEKENTSIIGSRYSSRVLSLDKEQPPPS